MTYLEMALDSGIENLIEIVNRDINTYEDILKCCINETKQTEFYKEKFNKSVNNFKLEKKNL